MNNYIDSFFKNNNPENLTGKFGSPLYVYKEDILRERCREMKSLVDYPHFRVNYSIKANSSLKLMEIVRSEGLSADAMSPGEIFLLQKAGFEKENIYYVGNNVPEEELLFAFENAGMVSLDSLSQLETYGELKPGSDVSIRINPGIGAGHSESVTTAGKNTKFGITIENIPEAKKIASKYNLKVKGINQHVGSLFMKDYEYLNPVSELLKAAVNFDDLDFIDLGGGFGIPYHKFDKVKKENRLDLKTLGDKLTELIIAFNNEYGKEIEFRIEPGRYISAEAGVLLGTVHSIKKNYDKIYFGTDIGFNVLIRPVMYDSFHEILFFRNGKLIEGDKVVANIVGNICETGDYIAKERLLPVAVKGDTICVVDAGAYGYSMSSNYNSRLRPAEVLIDSEGGVNLIRKMETFEDLARSYVV